MKKALEHTMVRTYKAAQRFLHKALMKQPTEFKLDDVENDLDYFLWEPQVVANVKDNGIDFLDYFLWELQVVVASVRDNGIDFEAFADQDIEVDVNKSHPAPTPSQGVLFIEVQPST